jgi:excisionase family DNA binding protein
VAGWRGSQGVMNRQPLLTIDECAERLSVHHGKVRRLIGAGKIVASKIGRDWRVDPDQLEAYITNQRPVQPQPVEPDNGLTPEAESRYA